MAKVSNSSGAFSLSAYPGDAKVLLAFDLTTPQSRQRLAGFTIQVTPAGHPSYYLWNNLSFEHPDQHAQVAGEPSFSTANAPIHKFRWVHVPGLDHQGLKPPFTAYSYTVTPRYFDANARLLPLDPTKGVTVVVPLQPFVKGKIRLGFTRGYVQSQAFVNHFGKRLPTRPSNQPIDYDTSLIAGKDPKGNPYSYAAQYEWLGFTARDLVFDLLEAVDTDPHGSIDIFAYDFNEPDIIKLLLKLGKAGKARIILDNAALHHDTGAPKVEDKFEQRFVTEASAARIKRGKFGRYAHDKVFVVYRNAQPQVVLTGSTNFSVTGLYVNSNHVIVYDDPGVADLYARVFKEAWDDNVSRAAFVASDRANRRFPIVAGGGLPAFDISFSPHQKPFAAARLDEIVQRCTHEAGNKGNVFFAVMEMASSLDSNPVYKALNELHKTPDLFSYGISDNPEGIYYYPVAGTTGVLVTGRPTNTRLPPPFNQVPNVGLGHQVHHKFVVCGFGGADPVVFCGSSNLALAGEQVNGDNLLCIHDEEVVTAFVIEALLLIDHFNFLGKTSQPSATAAPAAGPAAAPAAPPPADKRSAAQAAGWFLGTTDAWAKKYFDPNDLHCRDRVMFA
jgi:hypothetical protein